MSISNRREPIVFLSVVVSVLFLQTGALSQGLWGAPKQQSHANSGTMVKLKEAVTLDNLPDFTGKKKFLSGTMNDAPSGKTWMQNYCCRDSAQEVYNWYKQVLQMQQWKIRASNEQQIMAEQKSGAVCTISISPVVGVRDVAANFSVAYYVPNRTR